MKHSSRLFTCKKCHAQVLVCSCCDRGQIYCGTTCSAKARRQSCQNAEKRYQLTTRGRLKHALRQKHYRMRKKQKVTDQGSIATEVNGLLSHVENKAIAVNVLAAQSDYKCCFCKKTVSSYFRSGFLRRHTSLTMQNSPYLRPP